MMTVGAYYHSMVFLGMIRVVFSIFLLCYSNQESLPLWVIPFLRKRFGCLALPRPPYSNKLFPNDLMIPQKFFLRPAMRFYEVAGERRMYMLVLIVADMGG